MEQRLPATSVAVPGAKYEVGNPVSKVVNPTNAQVNAPKNVSITNKTQFNITKSTQRLPGGLNTPLKSGNSENAILFG
jgi:hypothetical protein